MWSSSLLLASSDLRKAFLIIFGLLSLLQPAFAEERITLFCPNIPRKEAILVAAFQAGKEVVFFEDPPGNVTLKVESIGFEDALDTLLEGTGILWHEKNDVYYIGTPKEGTPEYVAISDVEACESRFVTAQDILALHPEFVGKLLPVTPFRFLIAGPERLRATVKRAIQELDHPREHILLEATLLATTKKGILASAFSFPDTIPLTPFPHPEREEKLQGTLRDQEEKEYISLCAEQKLLILEGEWGESWIGQQAYYVVEESLRVIELGTGIRARPVFLGNNHIRVDLEIRATTPGKKDPLTIVRRMFTTSVVLEEGKTVPVTLVEERREVVRARKLFARTTQSGQAPEEEETGNFILLVRAKREHPENLPSLAHLEGPPIAVQGLKSYTPNIQGFLEYRTPGFLGTGFTLSLDGTVRISGSFFHVLEGTSFLGDLELSFPLGEDTTLGACWRWTEKAQGWFLFLEEREKGYFFRIGGGRVDTHTVSFVSLGGEYRENALALRGALTYRMDASHALWLDLEGQWEIRKNVAFLAGYSGLLSGERTSLDDLQFEGFFVGLRITF